MAVRPAPMSVARSLAATALVVLVWACSPGVTPTPGGSGLPRASASSVTAGTSAASSPSPTGLRCGDSRGSLAAPTYAFLRVSIPAGSDSCQDIGPLASPQFLSITNDGPNVAFNARDAGDSGNLWYGDLRTGSVKVVYKATEAKGAVTDIWTPQLAAGKLLWIEDVHDGDSTSDPVKAWSLKTMDIASGTVTELAHDDMPKYGGRMYADSIKFDGKRIAVLEALADGTWRIEVRDLSGTVQGYAAVPGDPYDFALTSDGLLFTSGTQDPVSGAVGHMHLWRWTVGSGTKAIGTDSYQVNSDGGLAAWVLDPDASKNVNGWFRDQRLYAAASPFTAPKAISPVLSATGTMGLDGMAVGSGTVAWWERESYVDQAWLDVLTLWQPGWSSPIQVDTGGSSSYFVSANAGWLVWTEEDGRGSADQKERVRGIPLSVLASERGQT